MKYFDFRYYAFKIANFTMRELEQSHAKRYEYYYGSYIVLVSIYQFTLFLTIGFVLGIFKEALIAIATFVSLRFYAGGFHSNSLKTCTVISLSIIMTSVFLGRIVPQNLVIPIFIISFILLLIYAPRDHKNKPIINIKTRQLYRILSITIFIFWTMMNFILKNYSGIITIALLIECVSLIKIKNIQQCCVNKT